MEKADLVRVIQDGIDEGLDADDILRDLERFGLAFVSGPRHPDDVKAIDLLNRWYWLMRDVADGRAFSRVSYTNEYRVIQEDPNGADVGAPEGVENWCGTTAGAVGMAALAGLFEGIELTLENGKVVGEPNCWENFDANGVLLSIDYAKVSTVEPYEDVAEVAAAISGVLEGRYNTLPTPLPDSDRPWLGVHAPFEPKARPVMRW